MSMDAKTEILARLAGALSDRPQAPEVPRDYRRTSELSRDEIVDMLGMRRQNITVSPPGISSRYSPAGGDNCARTLPSINSTME